MKKKYVKPEMKIIPEIWKVCKDTRILSKNKTKGNLYEVSNMGRCRKNGILVNTYTNNKKLRRAFVGKRIYRWVAELFIPNPENKPCVDHIDTNPLNNCWYNLRWATTKENCNNPLSKINYSEAQKKYYKEHPERRLEISKQHKNKKMPKSFSTYMKTRMKGENNPAYDRKWMTNGINRIYIKSEDTYKYIEMGYHFGMK